MKKLPAFLVLCITVACLQAQPALKNDLQFDTLATRWDEAIPLGNATIGALVWQKDGNLRFSLDRADLWDQRPMKGLHRPEFTYQWVYEQVMKKNYTVVQQYFDEPYEAEPAPSKIPAGALQFDTKSWGTVELVHLYLKDAECEVKWANGVILKTFVHATKPVGWFRFENIKDSFIPQLIAPKYEGITNANGGSTEGDDLARLGYARGQVKQQGNSITYMQQGWGGFTYEINVRWKQTGNAIEGVWSISSHYAGAKQKPAASTVTMQVLGIGYTAGYVTHVAWWKSFWDKSSIHVPDALLEKQWYLEQYKFGSASRRGAPPISLQSVWTADNGRLPPWKGDFHHDLNTQLSYWPAYTANHLDEAMAYIDHLQQNTTNYKRYTKLYFGKEGIAVPGVTTLDGTEMGGWIQYSCSPTISAWLSQHYYWQWRYSMDTGFLQHIAYPWVKGVATFLENITIKNEDGKRQLPISSSPEINDNDISAWFLQNTNYDLALMKFVFNAAAEMAGELGLVREKTKWQTIGNEFKGFALSDNSELKISPTLAFTASHRHFSNMMAVYPLGLIKWEDGETSQKIINNSIHVLDSLGPAYWCGYSYSWLANLKARAKDGDGAVQALQIFAKAFCSPNSFHLNGDQTKSGFSKFTYRPFTLEGNFAFAAGLQEMLLQSYAGFIEVMPAVPAAWKDISFSTLRAQGAFLVSAKKEGGQVTEIKIVSEKGGVTKLKLPFKTMVIALQKNISTTATADGFVTLVCKPGGRVVFKKVD